MVMAWVKVKAASSTRLMPKLRRSSTRAERIDQQFAKAGWTASSRQVIEECWLSGSSRAGENDNKPDARLHLILGAQRLDGATAFTSMLASL